MFPLVWVVIYIVFTAALTRSSSQLFCSVSPWWGGNAFPHAPLFRLGAKPRWEGKITCVWNRWMADCLKWWMNSKEEAGAHTRRHFKFEVPITLLAGPTWYIILFPLTPHTPSWVPLTPPISPLPIQFATLFSAFPSSKLNVCSGFCNKTPYTGCLKNNRNFYLTVLEVRSLKSGFQHN